MRKKEKMSIALMICSLAIALVGGVVAIQNPPTVTSKIEVVKRGDKVYNITAAFSTGDEIFFLFSPPPYGGYDYLNLTGWVPSLFLEPPVSDEPYYGNIFSPHVFAYGDLYDPGGHRVSRVEFVLIFDQERTGSENLYLFDLARMLENQTSEDFPPGYIPRVPVEVFAPNWAKSATANVSGEYTLNVWAGGQTPWAYGISPAGFISLGKKVETMTYPYWYLLPAGVVITGGGVVSLGFGVRSYRRVRAQPRRVSRYKKSGF